MQEITMSKVKMFAVSGVLVVGIVAYYSNNIHRVKTLIGPDDAIHTQAAAIESIKPVLPDEALIAIAQVPAEKIAHSSNNAWNSPSGYEEVEQWKISRGYFSMSDIQTYAHYGAETIKKLAMEGDLKAIEVLARMQIQAGAELHEIVTTYFYGAIFGSTKAIGMAGNISKPNPGSSRFSGEKGADLFKKESLEALAIYQVSLLRGDREVQPTITEVRKNLSLTPNEEQLIQDRAQEIYQDLLDRRKQLGLGDFDNTVPEKVDDYFNAMERGFPTVTQ